jgi:hypothetical protein
VGYYDDFGPGPDFKALIDKCMRGEINVVFAESSTWLGKPPLRFHENIRLLREYGVEVITEESGISYDLYKWSAEINDSLQRLSKTDSQKHEG